MLKNILLLFLGFTAGAIATLVTLYIKNSNYYLDHPWWMKGVHYDLKVRVHTTCDSVHIMNAQDEVLTRFEQLQSPAQFMLFYYASEKNSAPFTVKAYTAAKTLTSDPLFKRRHFESLCIEENLILIRTDTIQ